MGASRCNTCGARRDAPGAEAPFAGNAEFEALLEVPEGAVEFDASEKDDGLATTNGVLPGQFGCFSPLERVFILANGNLQSIASAWAGRPVHVRVVRNNEVPCSAGYMFDREVEIFIDGAAPSPDGEAVAPRKGEPPRRLLVARSAVNITSAALHAKVQSGAIGLGQLFRKLDAMPRFELLHAGRQEGGVWRLYELRAPHIRTRILEVFDAETMATLQ